MKLISRLATVVAALALAIAVPTSAMAASYGDSGSSPSANAEAGKPTTMVFKFDPAQVPGNQPDGAFASADDAVSFAVLRASAMKYPVSADSSVTLKVAASQPGTYTISVTASGVILTGTLTVTGADGGLASTGYDLPILLIVIAGVVILLGVVLLIVVLARRRATRD